MLNSHEIILKNSSILIAEDEERVRESFKKLLGLYVDSVFCACDGEEALSLYEEKKPDILITDVKMPKIDGIELIKKIRESDKKIPIIVTSAYTDQNYLLESIKLSLIEYVVKPMKESDLNRVLKRCAEILQENSKTIISFDELTFYDFVNKTFVHDGKEIKLTQKEVEFLELLLAHRGDLVTKQTIEDNLYIYEEAPPSALKNLVFKLRKKLPKDLIQTRGKLGYLIELQEN